MRGQPPARARKQRGALIVALMAGIAIVMILSTVAAQSWGDIMRRDNEAEMMFRAQDIVRALKRFQADKGKLPVEFKELMEPGQKGQYFLRRLWKDPLVKGGKWQFVYASPGGGLFDPTVPSAGGPPHPNDPGGLQPFGGLDDGKKDDGKKHDEKKDDETKAGGLNPDGSFDPTGLPIAGVKTRCTDRPFRRYREQTEYNQWVFSVFDLDPHPPAMKAPAVGTGKEATFPPTQGK